MNTEHELEFKNFECDGKVISADMYVNGEFIVKLTDSIEKILKNSTTDITLYEFYKIAVREYLSYDESYINRLYITPLQLNTQ